MVCLKIKDLKWIKPTSLGGVIYVVPMFYSFIAYVSIEIRNFSPLCISKRDYSFRSRKPLICANFNDKCRYDPKITSALKK